MDRNCEQHTFELADGECRMCHGAFCVDCLLRPFGDKKPPMCKACAITAGGVRRSAARPVRAIKTEGKQAKRGIMARLRGAVAQVEPEEVLTAEEATEREAEEIAQMMADQRLPEVEKPEPEPVPIPENIAPPGLVEDVGDERPARRDHPQEVSGGLDLPNKGLEADPAPSGTDDGSADPVAPAGAASAPSPSRAPQLFESPEAEPEPAEPPTPAESPTPAEPQMPAEAAGTVATDPPATAGPAEAQADEITSPAATAATDVRPGSETADGGVDELLRRIGDLRGS